MAYNCVNAIKLMPAQEITAQLDYLVIVLTCSAAGELEHALPQSAASGSASKNCCAVFFIYRQHCAFRGAAKRHVSSDMRAAVPEVE